MATLAKEELLKYLKDAIELESSLVTQEQIRDAYRISSDKRKPKLLLQAPPKVPVYNTIGEWDSGDYGVVGLLAVFGTLLLPSGIIMTWCGISEGYAWMSLFGLLMAAAGFAMLSFMVYCIVEKKGLKEKAGSTYSNAYVMYEKRKEEVNVQNELTQKKYNQDNRAWQTSNAEVFNYLNDKQSQTQNVLDKLYAKEVIFPKYRNLPALTSIYEYILSGRCEELTGATGAYNLYEEELRKDIVIAQLNTIISNLEQIRQNQYMLYEEIKKVQRNTAVIAVELDAIRGYTAALTELTALNTFYNGIAASNSQIMAYWG